MERSQYIELCRQCAMLNGGILGIKRNVPDALKVTYNGVEYYPVSYTISFDGNGKPRHTATLHDLVANSVTDVELVKVEGKG